MPMHFGRGIPPTPSDPSTPPVARVTRLPKTSNGIGRKSNRKARAGNPQPAYDEATERANGRCEANIADDCTGRAEARHHRKFRSRGGKHTADNLLVCCHPCHRHLHARSDSPLNLHAWEECA